jgi:SAM-dependent methyltransferase
MPRSLDLGSGEEPRGIEGWERWGIDLVGSPSDKVIRTDLAFEPIPFPADHFERVYAYDFLEHLPMRAYVTGPDGRPQTVNVMLNLFNEIWRVLTPGGTFESFTPHVPHWSEVFRDPTHVSFWTAQTWEYLAQPGEFVPLTRRYGLKATFELVSMEWRGAHLFVLLRKIPVRPQVARSGS